MKPCTAIPSELAAAIALLSVLAPVLGEGAQPGTLVERTTLSGRTTFLAARAGDVFLSPAAPGLPITRPDDFLTQHGVRFGIENPEQQLIKADTSADAIGHVRTTYRQVHEGIPVFSGIVYVHQDASGAVIAANGDFHQIGGKLDTTPRIDAAMAAGLAIEETGGGALDVEQADLVVVDPGWYGDPERGPQLAYHVVVSRADPPEREALFIDARTGATMDRWSLIYDGKARAIHDGRSGSDCCFTHEGSTCDDKACELAVCEMRPACCEDGWASVCAAWASYLCDSLCLPGALVRAEGALPTGVADVDAVYDYVGDTYDYFWRAFARDGIDGEGGPIVATTRTQAIGCPNAIWTGEGLQMAFCEGVASDDVVAHEMTHGITQFTANLIYQNQPGQLNESFSDVFGELVDLFNGDAAFVDSVNGPPWPTHETGPGTDWPNGRRTGCSDVDDGYPDGVRWLAGEDALAFGGAIRDMWAPPCGNDPDRAFSPLQTCDILDAGGVHSGSGIPNHAFALLVDGGYFNRQFVRGIGPIKAGAVWYRALTTYLTIASDFEDAYAALNQAAYDLIGTIPNDPRTGLPSSEPFTPDDATSVDRALLAVEMDGSGRCGAMVPILDSSPAAPCGDPRVIFEDDFENGEGGWQAFHEPLGMLPTPYDWIQTAGSLPYDRAGTVWFCDDPQGGDCDEEDESAVHYLLCPPIVLPEDARFPYAAFTHYLASESGWDGGTVGIRVNNEPWRAVPRKSFEFNPFNTALIGPDGRNTNPLAGRDAWSGVGGEWGTSTIDLSGLATGGDVIRLRFEFGKDGCGGFDGWYVDDFRVYDCPDCDLDGRSDQQAFRYIATSETRHRIGIGASQHFVFESPPAAVGDVRLIVDARGDFSTAGEALAVYLDGRYLATLFTVGGADCPLTPNRDELVIPADVFNESVSRAEAVFELVASEYVNPELCLGESLVMVTVVYDVAGEDSDGDLVLDVCQNCEVGESPIAVSTAAGRSRYLSVFPGNPDRRRALRVCAIELPPSLANWLGTCLWASNPTAVSLRPGQSDRTPPTTTMARLSCQPEYVNWGEHGAVHLYGELVVPGGVYEVRSVDLACGIEAEAFYTRAEEVATHDWADLAGSCDGVICPARDGVVDISDVMGVITAFEGELKLFDKIAADLGPGLPNHVVDVVDVVLTIEAYGGASFPYTAFSLPCGPTND